METEYIIFLTRNPYGMQYKVNDKICIDRYNCTYFIIGLSENYFHNIYGYSVKLYNARNRMQFIAYHINNVEYNRISGQRMLRWSCSEN